MRALICVETALAVVVTCTFAPWTQSERLMRGLGEAGAVGALGDDRVHAAHHVGEEAFGALQPGHVGLNVHRLHAARNQMRIVPTHDHGAANALGELVGG